MMDHRSEHSSEHASPTAPSGGSRRRPWRLGRLLLGLALVIGVGIAFLPRLLANPDRLTRLIAATVPELQGDVRIERVRLGWLGPIVLEDVAVAPRNGAEPPLAVGRIEATNGLAAILLFGGDIGTLRIERPRVTVLFDAERKSNLDGLFVRSAASEAATGRGPRRSPVRLVLEVDDAVVQIAGPWTQEPWISDPIDVRAALRPSADGTVSEWTIEPVRLLVDARMEPAVAQGVLAYIAPVLADATRTSGRFSLRLDGGVIPVGDPASGTVSGELAMHEVVLGPGPLVASLVQSLPGRIPQPPAIKLADESLVKFRLEDRRVFHDGLRFGLPLPRPGERLDMHSRGSVGLDDRSLALQLSVPIPDGLPQDRPLLASLAGKTISLGIGGELGAPKVEFDGSIAATASDVVGELVERLRTGNAGAKNGSIAGPPAGQPSASPEARPTNGPADAAVPSPAAGDATAAAVDVVGDLLEEIARRRAERRAAEAANPDQQQPRRGGRLIRRLIVPPTEASPTRPAQQALPPRSPTPPPAATLE